MDIDTLDRILRNVEKPSRYAGCEVNMIEKNVSEMRFRFALAFPDVYEVGMSHLGSRILYEAINSLPDVYCERVFAPWVDMEEHMRGEGVPLFSLETKTPLRAFDMIGFSLSYEMSYTNVLNMLELSGIPLRSKDRGDGYPLIIAGGSCAYNPEPLSPFVDLFAIGEGEELDLDIIKLAMECREIPRDELLKRMAQIPGVYVPSLYEHKAGERVVPLAASNAPEVIRKRIVTDLDSAVYPEKPILPYLGIIHDRMMLEVFRGCTRGCRFCQAGMIYRPLREKSPERVVELAKKQFESTGYEELSLTSLSTGDYSGLSKVYEMLDRELGAERVAVSLPSLRIDSFREDMARQGGAVRKTGLTFAPEAGSQRLRDVINKNVTEEDLLRSAGWAFENGYNHIKLYFMIGLPTETMEDIEELAKLVNRVADEYYAIDKEKRAPGLKITVSTAIFVPKAHTPFEWCAQDTIDNINMKTSYLRGAFKRRCISYSWHEISTSRLEACFALGDIRMADVLERAFLLGCRFDGWDEFFDNDKWMRAFADCGITVEEIANVGRSVDSPLPWDHIDCGVSKEYLVREYQKAMRAECTPDCRRGCNGCGADIFGAGGCL